MAPKREKVVTVHRLMAVLDQPEAAAQARSALLAEGFAPDAITLLQGDRDADRIDSFGKSSGPLRKLWRVVQFTQTDQMVDLVVYEAALRDGRAVVTVHTPRAEDRERAKRVLAAAGAHFMNFFGRLSTEDISRWRGKELPRHPNLYR
jgi:urease gamma subunit